MRQSTCRRLSNHYHLLIKTPRACSDGYPQLLLIKVRQGLVAGDEGVAKWSGVLGDALKAVLKGAVGA